MWERIYDFFTVVPLWELALIFFSRIVEVSIGTLRIILINKGYRKQGVILAFFEVSLWVFIASRVITGIAEEPIKGIIYSFGFACGVYVGSKLENRLAYGQVLIQAITTPDLGIVISESLRSQGYGVTSINAQGKDNPRTVIMVYANRKGKEIIIEKISQIDDHAMIISNDITSLRGGYIAQYRRFVK